MRKTIVILLLFTAAAGFAQRNEFKPSTAGLIYPDSTISQLKYIVDSLNLKFKVCELHKTFLGKAQARAHAIRLSTGNILQAKKDMEANIPFEEFVRKYPGAEIERELLTVRFQYPDYKGSEVVEFTCIEFGSRSDFELTFREGLARYKGSLKGKWVFTYNAKTKYSEESVEAIYFPEELSQKPLPETYARMVQYSECMVDTSAQVFVKDAGYSRGGTRNSGSSAASKFISYVHEATKRPTYTKAGESTYWQRYNRWDSLRLERVDSLRKNDPKFSTMLTEAINNLEDGEMPGDEFEEYVGRYYSKKAELELKRRRRVVGNCSQDDSPRVHAFNIARLSAETVNWEIFLRSHLDIMNDRFDRMSDGSYAWAARKTYIRELEVLNINVLDLLLGISLRVENPGQNHYYGSIGRLGRALAETSESEAIEAKMLQMISDVHLDDYNRVLIYYLFQNYNHYLESKERKEQNKKKIQAAVDTLPEYLAKRIRASR